MQDFNSFSITFNYIISATHQKIGDLFCPVHIYGLLHDVPDSQSLVLTSNLYANDAVMYMRLTIAYTQPSFVKGGGCFSAIAAHQSMKKFGISLWSWPVDFHPIILTS